VDTKELGLHLLRKNIAFIPQQPFLFQGTVYENLDPFKEKTGEDVLNLLEDV
jgi:ATP-binding cassette subfamily C (CFTR/MRP) protein 1